MCSLVVEPADAFRLVKIEGRFFPRFPDGRFPGTFVGSVDLSAGKADVAGPGIARALSA